MRIDLRLVKLRCSEPEFVFFVVLPAHAELLALEIFPPVYAKLLETFEKLVYRTAGKKQTDPQQMVDIQRSRRIERILLSKTHCPFLFSVQPVLTPPDRKST